VRRLQKLFQIVRFRGLNYLVYIVRGYLVPRLFIACMHRLSKKVVRRLAQSGVAAGAVVTGTLLCLVTDLLTMLTAVAVASIGFGAGMLLYVLWKRNCQREMAKKMVEAKRSQASFTEWAEYPVSQDVRRAVEEFCSRHAVQREVVLGQVDSDGRMKGIFGPLPGWINISAEEFVPRERTQIDVVLRDGKVLIRKDFKGDRGSFLREWYALARLMGKAKVPAIYDVDVKKNRIYKNLIYGDNLNDLLVKAGAEIHNVVTEVDPSLMGLDGDARIFAVLERGCRYLNQVVSSSFYDQLEEEMRRIHRCGVTSFSVTFGNIVIDPNGQPWFVDFDKARCFRSTRHLLFLYYRDRDLELYNKIYKRDHLTEKRAREVLRSFGGHWYAPIDFGSGLAVRGFWSIDSGSGRWEAVDRKVLAPLIKGKRILDLGSNNGCMPLMMLRDGAREVVGLEIDPQMVQRAKAVHRIMEWRDMRRYAFTVYECDMRAILDKNFGEFDIVTAFASLYYLSREDMARVVRKASTLAPVMIVQAKDDTRPEAGDKRIKSSTSFLKELLEKNGFPNVDVIAFRGYPRPILIGRVEADGEPWR